MAVVVRERYSTRRIETIGGSSRGFREYTVYDDSSPITSPDAVYLLLGTGTSPDALPDQGDSFPGALLEAADVQIKPHDEQADMWVVSWTYVDVAFLIGGNELQPLDPDYVDVSASGVAEFRDQWLSFTKAQFAALVAPGAKNAAGAGNLNLSTGAMGTSDGTFIDFNGEPTSTVARSTKLSVTVTKAALPILGSLTSHTGTRNSATFWGAAVGSLAFVDYSVARASRQRWRVTYEFVLDDAYHLRQQPYRNPDGSVKLFDYGASLGGFHPNSVFHVQPFPDTYNFYLIDPAFTGVI